MKSEESFVIITKGSSFLFSSLLFLYMVHIMRYILLLTILFIPSIAHAELNEWYHINGQLLQVTYNGSSTCYSVGTKGMLLHSPDKGESWRQIPTGVSDSLLSIAFSDALHGVIVGENGIVISTSDNGQTWIIGKLGVKTLRAISFHNRTGMIVGDNGVIFRSDDNGKNWIQIQTTIKVGLYSIIMVADSTIMIGAEGGLIFRSTDNGNTWNDDTAEPVFNFLYRISEITVSAERKVFALAVRDKFSFLLVSSDSGKTWNSDTIALPNGTKDITFPNNDFGFAVSNSSQINLSTDGGRNFTANHNFDSTQISVDDLYSVLFIDRKIGIAVGASKTIYRTNDGGINWKLLSFLPNFVRKYTAVQFITEDTGYVGCGSFGLIFRTVNGGATWLPQRTSATDTIISGSEISSLYFYDSKIGIACPVSSGGSVLRTTDGGENYSQKFSLNESFAKIHTLNPNFTVMVGAYIQGYSQSKLSISTDQGVTWSIKVIDSIALSNVFCASNSMFYFSGSYQTPANKFNYSLFSSRDSGRTLEKKPIPQNIKGFGSIYFFDENTGIAAAGDNFFHPLILRTEDGCSTWSVVDSGRFDAPSGLPALTFTNQFHGYAGGSNGLILETFDSGKTWKKSPSPYSEIVLAISALGNDFACAVGGFNTPMVMKKLPKSFYTSVSESKIEITPTVWLYSPRPVPSSGKVHIDAIWVMNVDVSSIQIKLYDMLGLEIKDISSSLYANNSANTGTIEFDGSNLLSGIYYIEIRGGGGRMSVPIMITK